MHRSHLWRALFLPSLLSGILVTLTTITYIIMQAWAYVSHNQLFYDQLFGPYSVTTALIGAPDAWAVVRRALNSTLAYYIVLTLCAAIIGVAVYELLEIGTNLAHRAAVKAFMPSGNALKEKLARLGIRALSLLVWAAYIFCTLTLFLPFITLLLQNGIDAINIGNLSGWLQVLAATLGLWFGLHTHVVFLRLCLLRPRIFGGWDIELAS